MLGTHSTSRKRIEPTKTIVSYAARIKDQTRECEFCNQENDRILEHLIETIRDEGMAKQTIKESWDLILQKLLAKRRNQ